MKSDRRLGRLRVALPFLDLENIAARALMKEIVVLRAEHDYERDAVTYIALCEAFQPVPPHLVIPLYDAVFDGMYWHFTVSPE